MADDRTVASQPADNRKPEDKVDQRNRLLEMILQNEVMRKDDAELRMPGHRMGKNVASTSVEERVESI